LIVIHDLIVIGDSLIIIRHMIQGTSSTDIGLASIIDRIRKIHQAFTKISYYHVKRENNKEVDQLPNLATLKRRGV
jgi:hypothetical protein